MWRELGIALCLMLVLEGVLPFLYPRRWRNMVVRLAQVDDGTMRMAGLVCMLVGTALLYLIKQ
ncbi:DUF2065 domain-containing protein [Hahella aquimaris]|uniref:DUF2065 domain-containing protein n=1 Tax=Hahella sp. HNIBRBA332 TaxID=3015983 RepID=UPI00273BE00C|nr:DUF2065 domain-containing protein [Hahella sp. HNIBRBA332]WLQ14537.1 DUF2065 domain-containing protein [Hahella sp. HNIBRBA332]